MITVKELINSLSKFDENAIVVVSGCYSSMDDNLYAVSEMEEKEVSYFGYGKNTKVIIIDTDICSGWNNNPNYINWKEKSFEFFTDYITISHSP